MSVCAVCGTAQKRSSEDLWFWHDLESGKLYFLCSINCKELYLMNPLVYQHNVQPLTIPSQYTDSGTKARLEYWERCFKKQKLVV